MSEDLKIGVTSESNGRGSYSKTSWFKIPKDSTVVFRILPPLHSLAERGIYGKYYPTHYGFKDSKGVTRPFVCVEEKNKDKMVTKHCPVCDMVGELEQKLKLLESQGHDSSKIKAFRENNIMPFKASKRYYVNAIDANGDIGVLTLPITAFQDLERIRKEQKEKGFDITGIKGAYIEISRSGFGFDTTYRVALAQEEVTKDGETFYRVKRHELTPDIISAMKTKTRDLGNLFKTLDAETIAALVSVDGTDRAELVDTIFSTSEKSSNNEETNLSSSDLSLGVKAIGRVSLDKGDVKLEKPYLEDVKRTEAPVVNSAGSKIATTTDDDFAALMSNRKASTPSESQRLSNSGDLGGSNSAAKANPKTISDDEFLRTFGKVK